MPAAHRTALAIAALLLIGSGCGASNTATLELELHLDRPEASASETATRIERRLRIAGGDVVREVEVAALPAHRYQVSVALALPERCQELGEVRAALVDALTRPGRLGFHRAAAEPGARQIDALAARLPEGSLEPATFTPGARVSRLAPEALREAIAALPPVEGVRLALEERDPHPTREAAPTAYVWALEEPAAMDGTVIASALVVTNETTNRPEVLVEFDERGQARFADLSAALVNDFLVIVLDGRVVSSPKVMEPIRGGRATLSFGAGAYTSVFTEAKIVAAALSTPALAERVILERVAEICHE